MDRNATAIQILRALKNPNRSRANPPLLWVDRERRKAGFHDGHYGYEVNYNEAVIARGDPSLVIVPGTGDEIFVAE